MHYIHTLTAKQKKAVIFGFIALPVAVLAALTFLWAYNSGMFKRMVNLKTVVHSAHGIDTQTAVTLSGIAIGNVTNVQLQDQDAIEVSFRVDSAYAARIREDSLLTLSSVNIIGAKEIRVHGGSKGAPAVKDGDFIAAEESVDMGNLMDRVNPILVAAERMVGRLDKMLEEFPDDRLNSSVTNLSGILSDIKEGKASMGKLVSTDNGEFYHKLNKLVAKLNDISDKVDDAAKHLPETMENTAAITRDARAASHDLPEMQKTMHQVLKNLNRVLDDIAAMAPAINKAMVHAGTAAQDVSKITPRLPGLIDDVEQTLNETMVMMHSIKASWPVKNMVPKGKEHTLFEPTRRESPYTAAPATRAPQTLFAPPRRDSRIPATPQTLFGPSGTGATLSAATGR
jgi:phospholipid/cholesterol/gamma-HCH transport system substrate-binding protein